MATKIDHQNGDIYICVDRLEGDRAGGRIFSRRLAAPMDFSDLGGLLLCVETLLERQNFPQAFQRMRSFTRKAPGHPADCLPEGAMSANAVMDARGEVVTVVLRILTRRNTTWQGTLECVERGERDIFFSELEFLERMERYLKLRTREIGLP